MFDSSSGITVM